jgi:hypothetical protein
LTLSSPNLDAPSTSAAAFSRQQTSAAATQPPKSPLSDDPSNNLPSPTWWRGTCDKNYYYGAYPLGASYRNVPSCGPLPVFGYPDVLVYFYEGAFPALEWECVELALRWMYQAYGVPPYAANGSGIVYNYAGDRMEKINNGIPDKAPVPGDVISYCPYCTYGHVSVVISSNVNDSGNGSIVVMEQNWTWGGQTILPVYGWKVIGDAGWVYGWLHSKIIPDPTPTPLPTCIPTPTAVAATPTALSTLLPYQMYAPSIFNGDLEPCS